MEFKELEHCFFCHNKWGKCTCLPLSEGFTHNGTTITEPNVTECGRFYIDPFEYYGDSYKNWILDNPFHF